jgi:hypothetical protein
MPALPARWPAVVGPVVERGVRRHFRMQDRADYSTDQAVPSSSRTLTGPSCSGSKSLALTPIFRSGIGLMRSQLTTHPQFEQRTNLSTLRPQL